MLQDARDWCTGRWWSWRAALLTYLGWSGARQLRDPEAWSLFSGLTLAVHEAGHLMFTFLGEFLTVLGGSLFQVAAPVIVGGILYRQRDYFGISVAGAWLSSSLANLAVYIGDARAQDLPLVGFTDDPEHDWYYLLARLGHLRQDTQYAAMSRSLAVLVLALSLAFGGWLCLEMARRKGREVD